MLIDEQKLAHWIEHFYGYGSWTARTWFIAHEDGGGDLPEEVAEKVNYFYEAHSGGTSGLCDLREFYRHMSLMLDAPKAKLHSTLYDFRFGVNAVQSTIWKNLVSFAHGYRHQPLPELLDYQKNILAQPHLNNEALLRLYPLPAANHHAWYYGWLKLYQLSFLKTRERYEREVYEKRMTTLLQKIKIHEPELVIFYGMSNITTLKLSVQEFFPEAKFKTVNAVKQYTPQHHLTSVGNTALVITTQLPTLRHRRVATGFDWEAFGKSVRQQLHPQT